MSENAENSPIGFRNLHKEGLILEQPSDLLSG